MGFKCGLEIHQQLDTRKLFCHCASRVLHADEETKPDFALSRRLRTTTSELGEVDVAAAKEAARARTFRYLGYHGLSCLVDADEEPPHRANDDAVDVTLTFAALVGARPVDEVHWMRKIVIDGSNTTGFQRTGLLALGGNVEGHPLQTIALEEDSCRKVEDPTAERGVVTYGLDRLGIPLIEVATAPTITTPEEARRVAMRLGTILRATGRVKRGLGTIRQDLNISIRGGARVEVKGVQELRLISITLDYEARRQQRMLDVAAELRNRGAAPAKIGDAIDASDLFKATPSAVLKGALGKGGVVLAIALPGFAGLLGAERKEDPRLGKELAGYAKADAGVRGLFHSDELPNYGVTAEEVARVRDFLRLGTQDAFALVADERAVAQRAMRSVRERAQLAFGGVLPEVRNADADGSTSYLRPLPGAARMYPETDSPPTPIPAERVARLKAHLPELPEQRIARYQSAYALSGELADQVVGEGVEREFEQLTQALGGEGTLVARTLVGERAALAAKGVDPETLTIDRLEAVFRAMKSGAFAKEALPNVLEAVARDAKKPVEEIVRGLGITTVGEAEVVAVSRKVVHDRAAFIAEKGEGALGPLMGLVMKELRGKADGQLVARVLTGEIQAALGKKV